MSAADLEQWYRLLEVEPGASSDELHLDYCQQMYRLTREGSQTELEQLKLAYAQLTAYLESCEIDAASGSAPADTGGHTATSAAREGESMKARAASHRDVDPAAGAPATDLELFTALLRQRLKSSSIQFEVKYKEQQFLVLFQVDQVPKPDGILPLIQSTVQVLKLPDLHSVKVYGLRKQGRSSTVVWSREVQRTAPVQQERFDRFSFNNLTTTALALPIATLLALILNASFVQIFLLPWQIWIHEFGHATVAWLSGRRALPLPFGWTNVAAERSLFVYFGILILLVLLYRQGWKENLRWPRFLAVGMALLQFVITWLVPQRAIEMLISFGGIGGEFYLSTFLMLCFYCRFPDRWRWDFWRYPILVIAASSFWKNFWFWRQVEKGQEAIPWGSLLGGQGDAGGDMDRLVDDFGWSPDLIITVYNLLGTVCLLVLIGVYLGLLFKQSPQLWPKLLRLMRPVR